jgi:hypothetical protein
VEEEHAGGTNPKVEQEILLQQVHHKVIQEHQVHLTGARINLQVVEVEQVVLETKTGPTGVLSAAGPGGAGSPIATTVFGPTAPSYGTPGPAPGRYFAGGGGGGGSSMYWW